MTLLEKPQRLRDTPLAPDRRRSEWILWVVLAFLIVAGITAAILLSTGTEGVPAGEVNAELAFDNHVASSRIAALGHATVQDTSLASTADRVLEGQFPGRLEMLETSTQRADQALGYTIERVAGR